MNTFKQESVGLVPLAASPEAIYEASTPLLYDLAVIIGATYQQNIEPTQAGKIPKRLANKLQPMLHGLPRVRYMNEEDEYVEMIFHIAQELGLVRLSKPTFEGLKPHFEAGSQLERWSHLDVVNQIWLLLQCWLKSFNWLDVCGVNFRQWDPFYWNPMAARGSVLEQLEKCKPGQWYSIASLLEVIWEKNPFELRPLQYNMRSMERRKSSAMRARWDSCEGEVYLGILASTLYELGVVMVGNQQQPGQGDELVNPDAFMLTELGASAISIEEGKNASHPPISSKRSLILQPNFELLLLEPDMPALYSVLPFAQVNQVDMVSRLTLTRASVLRGVEAGRDLEQMLKILEERSQKEIPQNVAYTMRDWVKLYKGVKISQVLLLEVSSEAAADLACSSAKLQPFNLRRLSPCTLIASSDVNLQELRRIFEKEGILVHFNGDILTRQHRHSLSFGMPR
ncbi:MAG: helicase-associated domain-containing protein [Ktedonobacteraceae bacterium]